MKRILFFIKKETVLVVAILLAVISMIFIPPDQQYPEYIDFRILGVLFGLMTCVAGVQQLGVCGIDYVCSIFLDTSSKKKRTI